MSVAVGIDLGTSNSCVAAVVDGVPTVLADSAGRRTQPSIVAFGYGGMVVVGPRAKQQIAFAPESTVYSVKRLIGRRFRSPEVERLKMAVAWGIAEGPTGDARARVQGKLFTAQEISGHVLRHMKQLAEEALKQPVDKAVITVPAYFNDQQRQATRDAATIAGLECLRVLNEPTAAALAYGFGAGHRQNVAIYDLGGGTFDISILRIEDDVFEVVSTAGDTFLGGDDIDAALMDHLIDELQSEYKHELELDSGARARLRDAAERAKIALSDASAVDVRVPNLIRLRGQPLHLNTRVTGLRRVGQAVEVTTDQGVFQAAKVILSAGAWLPGLVGGWHQKALKVQRQVQFWFEVEDVRLWQAAPVFIRVDGMRTDEMVYGFPITAPTGPAMAKFASEQDVETTDPDAVRPLGEDEGRAFHAQHVVPKLNGIGTACRGSTCLYTTAPDYQFRIGAHPDVEGVTLVSACSGHGFKHSGGIGEAVAEHVLGSRTLSGFD